MHLLIISCTPRVKEKSNTDKILTEFKKGYEENGNTTEILYLQQRKEWENIRSKFYENTNILFAIPLYVECIPGIMMEFLETLKPKTNINTKIGFILQGGFAEASQLRCCESYLEILPKMLGCKYNGTLIKGNMFPISFLREKYRSSMVHPFYDRGKEYAKDDYFDKKIVNEFAKPEYFSKVSMFCSNYVFAPLKKFLFYLFAKNLGCKNSLNYRPYEKYVKK